MRIAEQMPLWPAVQEAPVASLRHSQRARRVAVRIDAAGRVELVVPRGVSEKRALSFLASRMDWVRAHLQHRREHAIPAQEFPPARIALPALGASWRVFQAGGAGRFAVQERGPGMLEIRGSGTRAQLQRVLLKWLHKRAQPAFALQLDELAREHGFSFAALKLRRQRTRWGSCSSKGIISLNLALVFQPPEVVRYLLCHELAHTRHMNHSARFWDCVAACEPEWRRLDAQLLQGWRNVPRWAQPSAMEPA